MKPFVPYVVNTDSAHQVEFTERKSSQQYGKHAAQSKAPKECQVDYETPLTGSEASSVARLTRSVDYFKSCVSWSTVSTLTQTAFFSAGVAGHAGVLIRGLYRPLVTTSEVRKHRLHLTTGQQVNKI